MNWKEIIDTAGRWVLRLLERIASDTGIRVGFLLAVLVAAGLFILVMKVWRK